MSYRDRLRAGYRHRFEAIRRDLRELEEAEGVKLPFRLSTIAELELAGYTVDLRTGEIVSQAQDDAPALFESEEA